MKNERYVTCTNESGITWYRNSTEMSLIDKCKDVLMRYCNPKCSLLLILLFCVHLVQAATIKIGDSTIIFPGTYNVYWSNINTGSGPGGQPDSTDNLLVYSDVPVTTTINLIVDVPYAICGSISLGKAGIMSLPVESHGTITINGGSTLKVTNGLVYGDIKTVFAPSLVISIAKGTIDMSKGDGTLICHNYTVIGVCDNIFTNGKVIFDGATAIPNSDEFKAYNKLKISHGTSALLTGTTTVADSFEMSAGGLVTGGTFVINGNIYLTGGKLFANHPFFSVGGNLVIDGGGVVFGSSGSFYLTGDCVVHDGLWDNRVNLSILFPGNLTMDSLATLYLGLGTYTFTGAGKTIGGTADLGFRNMTINCPGTINMATDISVSNSLMMANGKLALHNNNMTIGLAGCIIGADQNDYIVADENGTLTMHVASASSTSYPIGSAAMYTPCTMALSGGSADDNFSVRMTNQVRFNGTSGTVVTADAVGITWFVDEEVSGGSNATLTVQWPGSAELTGFNRSACRLAQYLSGGWDYGTTDMAATGTNPYSVSRAGLTSFSMFAVGELNALPVTWLYVKGKNEGDRNVISWATASEFNNDYFVVETSSDGLEFAELARVKGAGTSESVHTYTANDQDAAANAITYYRIKQVDFNRAYAYSKVIAVTRALKVNSLVYTSPDASGVTNVTFEAPVDGTVTLEVFNINGSTVFTITDPNAKAGMQTIPVDVSALSSGTYIMRVNAGSMTGTTKFIKN